MDKETLSTYGWIIVTIIILAIMIAFATPFGKQCINSMQQIPAKLSNAFGFTDSNPSDTPPPGTNDPQTCDHNWNTTYNTDSSYHWRVCTKCGKVGTKTAHSGGTATCTAQANCSTCGKAYGSLISHNYINQYVPVTYQQTHSLYSFFSARRTSDSSAVSTDLIMDEIDGLIHAHKTVCSQCGDLASFVYELHSGDSTTCDSCSATTMGSKVFAYYNTTYHGYLLEDPSANGDMLTVGLLMSCLEPGHSNCNCLEHTDQNYSCCVDAFNLQNSGGSPEDPVITGCSGCIGTYNSYEEALEHAPLCDLCDLPMAAIESFKCQMCKKTRWAVYPEGHICPNAN